MKIELFLFSVAIFGVSGCGRMIEVSKDSSTEGIPFYIVKGATEQKTSWISPFYHVTVSIDTLVPSKGSTTKKQTTDHVIDIEKDLSSQNYTDLREFVQSKNSGLRDGKIDYKNVIDKFTQDYDFFDPYSDKQCKFVVAANTNTRTKYVDYKTPYYINVKKPFIGSSEMAAELNAEGTLSKASGKTEDKSIETIVSGLTSIVPIKEMLQYKWTGAEAFAPETEKGTEKPPAYPGHPRSIVTIKSESRLISYSLSRLWIDELLGHGPIQLNDTTSLDVSFTRTIDASNAKGDDKKDGSTNIDVSGKISIPKETPIPPASK